MKVAFEVVSILEIEKTEAGARHAGSKICMTISKNLDRNAYFDEEGTPNETGTKAMTNVLVQGLVGNIHQAHQSGLIDSAEHLRYIIAELERGFIAQVNVNHEPFDRHTT